jgi:tRNA A-37 threonylcarbamoyl transferase component Bud32
MYSKDIPTDLKGLDGRALDPSRLSTLSDLIHEAIGREADVRMQSRLRSKKNVVLHLRAEASQNRLGSIDFVAKLFVADTFQTEVDVLRLCQQNGVRVPEVITARDGVILMEYIAGENLVSNMNRTFSSSVTRNMARWYFDFHNATDLVKGDSILRNFILHNETLTGVDFEESHLGHWILDIAGSAASLLDTDPVFDSRKRVLAWELLDSYLQLRGVERTPEIECRFIAATADHLCHTARLRRSSDIMRISELVRSTGIPTD